MTLDAEPTLLNEPEIRHRIWQNLQRATQDRHHEWRTPVLATVGVDGFPQARTVVLRHADQKLGSLQIYSDSRSQKIADMSKKPEVLLVFWSKRLSWQLRVRATASVQRSGPMVDAVWSKVSQSAAAGDYLGPSAPGGKLPTTGAGTVTAIGSEEVISGTLQKPHHLAIITLQVQEMDWLELARSGHRRAAMSAESWDWLVP